MRPVRDSDYVAAVRNGDRKMLMDMYERLRACFNAWKRLCRDVAEEDASDVFQDSFVILWENIEHGALNSEDGQVYASRAGKTYDVQDLSAYFMRIVKNKYREMLRRNGKLPIFAADEDNLPDTSADDVSASRHLVVCSSIMDLPARCRQILTMFYYDGMSLDEILEALGHEGSYNGLKTRKHKCMQSLKDRVTWLFRELGLD